MKEYTVRISDAEDKALRSSVLDIQTWLNNAIHARARRAILTAIEDNTEFNPLKLSEVDRDIHIMGMDLETVAEKEDAIRMLEASRL